MSWCCVVTTPYFGQCHFLLHRLGAVRSQPLIFYQCHNVIFYYMVWVLCGHNTLFLVNAIKLFFTIWSGCIVVTTPYFGTMSCHLLHRLGGVWSLPLIWGQCHVIFYYMVWVLCGHNTLFLVNAIMSFLTT